MDVIEDLISFTDSCTYEDLPGSLVEKIKLAVLDIIGLSAVGFATPGAWEVSELIKEWGGNKQATIIGNGEKAPLPLAILCNTTAARAFDMDDVLEKGTVHPSVNVIPSALAVAEYLGGITGKELITAIAVGNELICRLSLTPKHGCNITGFNFSTNHGIFGAAATIGKLLKLNKTQMRDAMGLASCHMVGSQQGFLEGTSVVRVQQGMAPTLGLISAMLGQKGVTGPKQTLEGKFGYFNLYCRGEYDKNILLNELGKRFEAVNISLKPNYPCCRFTHGPIESIKNLVRDENIDVTAVEKITVYVTSRDAYNIVCVPQEAKQNPANPITAQFSLPFACAVALMMPDVSFDAFSEKAVGNEAIQSLAAKVECILEDRLKRSELPMPGRVDIVTRNGNVHKGKEVRYPKGHYENPMTAEEFAEKFRQCIRHCANDDLKTRSNDIAAMTGRLEQLENVAELTSLYSK